MAIASVVGKYVRELWVDDLARAVGWAGPAPSGYHDEATARLGGDDCEAIGAGVCRLPAGDACCGQVTDRAPPRARCPGGYGASGSSARIRT